MTARPIAAALALGALATGCVDNAMSIEFYAICAPPDDAEACEWGATCDEVVGADRLWATVTVGGAPNYLVQSIQLNNQLPINEDLDVGRVNVNDFIGDAWLLSYSGLAGVADKVHAANFTIPAEGSGSPFIPVIPVDRMTQIGAAMAIAGLAEALVVVEVRARGRLVGGQQIETAPFEVAVDVYNADYGGATCLTPTDIPFYCPKPGQTSSITCVTP